MKPPRPADCLSPARTLWLGLLWLCLGLATVATAGAEEDANAIHPAQQQVQALHQALLQSMREGEVLGFDGRWELLAPVVERTHDFELISRLVLSSHWGALQPSQREAFRERFRRLSIATYADRFDRFKGEAFEIQSQQELPRGQRLVRSRLIKADGSRVQFDYVLTERDGTWRIVNIVVDGVSDLALKQAEYRNVLSTHDFEHLLALIEEKIELARRNDDD